MKRFSPLFFGLMLCLAVAVEGVLAPGVGHAAPIDVTQPGDPIVAVPPGMSPTNETVDQAINNVTQKYLNFGENNAGLIVTPSVGATLVTGLGISQPTMRNRVIRRISRWKDPMMGGQLGR